ncbi:MAG: LapA family protein [Rubrivivax sp.]
MRLLVWLLRALLFFTLFAFALNNLHPATVHWFFGLQWSAPLVIVVLAAFGLGCAAGVLAMVPPWLRTRRQARQVQAPAAADAPASKPGLTDLPLDHPPRDAV